MENFSQRLRISGHGKGDWDTLLTVSELQFREGLARLLKEYPDIEVVAQSDKIEDVIEKATSLKPDVILISSQISDYEAEKAVTQIRGYCPEAKIAIIARPEEDVNQSLKALKVGARACLAKSISFNDFVKSIDLIASGRIIISPLFAEKFIEHLSKIKEEDDIIKLEGKPNLSEREIEVVKLIISGDTSKEIAERLVISVNTVNVHVKNIMKKLEMRNRPQLVAYAIALGLGDFP